jgi:molybdopterin-containing oxidoreductase family membrane subunit
MALSDFINRPIASKEIDNTADLHPAQRPALITGDHSFARITDTVSRIAEAPGAPLAWWIAFTAALGLLGLFLFAVTYMIMTGIGVWGNNVPVAWAFDIVNFVFWIGIGHAGTLISAILYLFRQKWRTGINRFAEAMTIFAVICAMMFVATHTGRPWMDFYLFPTPNQNWVWPQFKSPLMWDVFAVNTYFITSLLFWYMGMVPDLATLRDRAKTKLRKLLYGLFALGWRGSNRHWLNFEKAYLLLAAFSTPLVLSVHSVVSFDFATSQLPGWHTTIFPPYFVAGAIFGGFAMVVTLAVPARELFGLKNLITLHHLENCNKVILATGMIVGYAYAMEFFTAWYSGVQAELFAFLNRATGPYAWAYWTMIGCNVVAPQLFWSKKLRTSIPAMIFVAMCVNVGMWFERFVIIVTSLHRDFMPSSWFYYTPTWVDLCTLAGSFGLFFTLFLLFVRFLPVISMVEVKAVSPAANIHHKEDGH